jgi:hypothetical protein
MIPTLLRTCRASACMHAHRLYFIRGDRLVVTAGADRVRDPNRHRSAEIGAQQHILDIVEHGAVELALGDEVGDGRPERT